MTNPGSSKIEANLERSILAILGKKVAAVMIACQGA